MSTFAGWKFCLIQWSNKEVTIKNLKTYPTTDPTPVSYLQGHGTIGFGQACVTVTMIAMDFLFGLGVHVVE